MLAGDREKHWHPAAMTMTRNRLSSRLLSKIEDRLKARHLTSN